MAKARQQYFADEVTLQKENRDFAIQPELVEKLESIEAGAQVNVIETVKVNGEALIPDENKAVDVSVPLVEDTLYSTDPDKALSANQGKVLYDYIQNLASRGRYLSNWNTVTGLPTTNPVDNPYQYRAGDYYVVSNVAAEGGTNYRPNGSSYSWGVASTTVETETVKVGDYYTYDGQHWLLLVNTAREIAVDSSLSTTSTNPVENRVITNALNTKQNNISDLETIRSGAALGATALQPGDSLSELTGTSDDITQGTTNLFMTTAERSKLSNQSGVNTGDETQTTIKNKLGQASASTDGYLTSTDWNTFNNKQGTISDLETIRSNASAGKNASDTIATYGDIVTHDVNEFATASQGGKADTAIQPGDNVSELTNDAGYITDAYHDSTKQDKLIAGANIQIAADGKTISATDTTYVAGDFDIKDLADSTGLRAEWSGKQDELIAGNNIQIAADGKTISATDTKYTAGVNVSISNNNVISSTDSKAEWGNISGTLSDQTDLNTALGGKQDTLIAGANIQIASDGKTISATDTTYTAGPGIDITNGVISNTQTSAEWGNITGTLSDQADLQTALDAKQDDMVILKYGISTWNDFITAYQKNGVIYCRASSNPNPATGAQGRLAFMAYVNDADNPTEVEFQYYRSRSNHNSQSEQLDQVFVYKLNKTSGRSVTTRDTGALLQTNSGSGIGITWGNGKAILSNTGVTSINSQTGDVTLTIPTVPTNVSDFVNDAGYITANDLPTIDTAMSSTSTNAVQNKVIKDYVDTQVQEATSGAVSDTAYGSSWDGITGIAPSKNAVYDKISAMDTTIAGKQNTISDLSTIRSGAALGATALQSGDNVSELTNDAGFITKAVSDLTNYYTKSETYTKSEVADYVANFAGFKVVATLPTTDIKTTIIYLLGPVGTGADKYEEYIYSNNAWVKIGETSVDLTNYFNTSTDNSDSITQGSTNLFLTTAERTKLSNTSGTNTGDETKTTIQSKLGAATSSNDGYLTSADWTTFNGKQNALSTQTAYTSKGSATKVPQITTNSLGQVTGITEVTITQPDISGKADKTEVLTKTNTTSYTPSADYNPATKKYVDDTAFEQVQSAIIKSASQPERATEGRLWYDTTNDQLKSYDGTNWNVVGKEYSAGEGISIGDITKNGRQGPAPDGFYVPSSMDWEALKTVMDGLQLTTGDDWKEKLFMPFAGSRNTSDASLNNQGSYGYYWSSSPYGSSYPNNARSLDLNSSNVNADNNSRRANGRSVRCFKDSFVAPDFSWTTIQNGKKDGTVICGDLGCCGIYWNQAEGLISIIDDQCTTGYTIADKNLGATTVYNSGDTLSEANCGKYYQWGNNYGFAWTGSVTTSSTQVDASSYGPTNPYSSSTFITGSRDWSSVHNDDLWGEYTGMYTLSNAITNTGVLSVNGQTGDVTIASPDMSNYLAKDNTIAFTPTGDYNPATKKYVDDGLGNKLDKVTTTATYGRVYGIGTDGSQVTVNIAPQVVNNALVRRTNTGQITVQQTPSADTDAASKKYVDDAVAQAGETYNAGEGITIGTYNDYSAMQGPAPSGFHVPLNTEWQAVYDVRTALGGGSSDGTNFGIALKLPFAGGRGYSSANVNSQGTYGRYRSSSPYLSEAGNSYNFNFNSSNISPQYYNYRTNGFSVRCFRNSPIIPTSSWTKLYGTSIESGGIFWSSTNGLISLSGDGQTWITIADKNLGATQTRNSGDTLSEANCGGYFQRGNNYMFPFTGTVTTSSTQVDASTYGPGNYYNSSTFITGSSSPYDWSSVQNDNLWGATTGVVTLNNAIINTGVLSVNGQTGDLTLSAGDMSYSDFGWQAKTGASITLDLASTYTPSADFTVNAPATIKDGQTYILRVNNEDTAYTMTLGTNVTNPFGTDITLTDYGIDQFVFLAIGGKLELQPEGGGGGGAITADTTGTETSISKIWVGTEAEYAALSSYDEDTAYMTY